MIHRLTRYVSNPNDFLRYAGPDIQQGNQGKTEGLGHCMAHSLVYPLYGIRYT